MIKRIGCCITGRVKVYITQAFERVIMPGVDLYRIPVIFFRQQPVARGLIQVTETYTG